MALDLCIKKAASQERFCSNEVVFLLSARRMSVQICFISEIPNLNRLSAVQLYYEKLAAAVEELKEMRG